MSIEEAVSLLDGMVRPLEGIEKVDVGTCVGRTLATEVRTPISLPPFDSSAMDGYAIRVDENVPTNRFEVIGESRAGHPFDGKVDTHQCTRIFTGAMLPDGANAVVLQEDVKRSQDFIVVDPEQPIKVDMNVRREGSEITQDDVLLEAGAVISDFHVGLLASCGVETMKVNRKPVVAVFSTGDELQDLGSDLEPGQIYDSNRVSLKQLLVHHAVDIVDLGRISDDPMETRTRLQEASEIADLLLTSGGVSVGESDYVRPAVESLGTLTFWNIALKPGKPLAVGRIQDCLFFGLPGNPVSAVVTYLLFVNRAIELLTNSKTHDLLKLTASLTNEVRHSIGRREYQRGHLDQENGELRVSAVSDQGSNRLTSFADANCLIEVDENAGDLPSGTTVQVVLLNQRSSHIWTL